MGDAPRRGSGRGGHRHRGGRRHGGGRRRRYGRPIRNLETCGPRVLLLLLALSLILNASSVSVVRLRIRNAKAEERRSRSKCMWWGKTEARSHAGCLTTTLPLSRLTPTSTIDTSCRRDNVQINALHYKQDRESGGAMTPPPLPHTEECASVSPSSSIQVPVAQAAGSSTPQRRSRAVAAAGVAGKAAGGSYM